MGLKAGWLALFVFVWIIGAFLGSTFEFQSADTPQGQAYATGTATFTTDSRTVTGVATVWVAAMEGGLIESNTDLTWYKIFEVVNNTELTLYALYAEAGGAGHNYAMKQSPGWAGTGAGGYATSPVTKLEYLIDMKNAIQRIPLFGNIPIPIPNGEYFSTAWEIVTWQWSFMDGYTMIYWIFLSPFVVMGVLSMILLVYGIITGNLAIT